MGVVGLESRPPPSSVRTERVRVSKWAKRGLFFLEVEELVEAAEVVRSAVSDKIEDPTGR